MKRSILVAAAVVWLASSVSNADIVEYNIIDLGFSEASVAYSINNLGQITVNQLPHLGGDQSAYMYDNGVVTPLGSLAGRDTRAYAINDSGQIVGQSQYPSDHSTHAFLYENGSMIDIESGRGGSEGRDINKHGQVIVQQGFIYDNGTVTDLPKPTGYEDWTWYAEAINDNGDVTGYLRAPTSPYLTMQCFGNLSPPPPPSFSAPSASALPVGRCEDAKHHRNTLQGGMCNRAVSLPLAALFLSLNLTHTISQSIPQKRPAS